MNHEHHTYYAGKKKLLPSDPYRDGYDRLRKNTVCGYCNDATIKKCFVGPGNTWICAKHKRSLGA